MTLDLKDWADRQSPFIRLADGESFVGEYVSCEEVPNRFNLKKTNIRYTLLKDGEEKYFENGSAFVARIFFDIPGKSLVKITRHGEGPQTQYKIIRVDQAVGKVVKQQFSDEDEGFPE